MGKNVIYLYKKSRFSNFIYMERRAGQGKTMCHKDFKTACSDVIESWKTGLEGCLRPSSSNPPAISGGTFH